MNPKEILHSDLLDIIFDNRNKSYGAYALRRDYNHRLKTATAAGVFIFITLSFSINYFNPSAAISDAITWAKEEVDLTPISDEKEIETPKPEHKPVQQQTSTEAFTNHIQIVDNNVITNQVPTVDDLAVADIDVSKKTGVEPTGIPNPITPSPVAAQPEEKKPAEAAIQRQPEFPGGKEAWSRFLTRYLRMPEELAAGEKKTVLIRFLVSEDGSITQFTVVQSGGEAFDNEVIRVLKKMPKWIPAIQNGRNIAVTFSQPVTFQSVEE
jgi:periplasmic protein TonB